MMNRVTSISDAKIYSESEYNDSTVLETHGAYIDGRLVKARSQEGRKGKFSGGEGTVYLHPNDPNCVIKIYKSTAVTKRTIAKLKLLSTINEPSSSVILPRKLVYLDRSRPIGFVMRKANGLKLEDGLLHGFTGSTRLEIIDMTLSLLKAIESLYSIPNHDILIGDINPRNFLISGGGDVFLLDLDSMQIDEFPCPVGSPNYVSPSLIRIMQESGSSGFTFNKFLREEKHEEFALAVLIFQILTGGVHPYSHKDGGTPNENILSGIFPYNRDGSSTIMCPTGCSKFVWASLPGFLRDALYDAFKNPESSLLPIEKMIDLLNSYRDYIEDMVNSGYDGYNAVKINRFLEGSGLGDAKCSGCHRVFLERKLTKSLCPDCKAEHVVYQTRLCIDPECHKRNGHFIYSTKDRESGRDPLYCPECEKAKRGPYTGNKYRTCKSCHRLYTINSKTKDYIEEFCPDCSKKANSLIKSTYSNIRRYTFGCFMRENAARSLDDIANEYVKLEEEAERKIIPYMSARKVQRYLHVLRNEKIALSYSYKGLANIHKYLQVLTSKSITDPSFLLKARKATLDRLDAINSGVWDSKDENGNTVKFASNPFALRLRDKLLENLNELDGYEIIRCSECSNEYVIEKNREKELLKDGKFICQSCLERVEYTCPLCEKEHEVLPKYRYLKAKSMNKLCQSCEEKKKELLESEERLYKSITDFDFLKADLEKRGKELKREFDIIAKRHEEFAIKNLSVLPPRFYSLSPYIENEESAFKNIQQMLRENEQKLMGERPNYSGIWEDLERIRVTLMKTGYSNISFSSFYKAFPSFNSIIKALDGLSKNAKELREESRKKFEKTIKDSQNLITDLYSVKNLRDFTFEKRLEDFKKEFERLSIELKSYSGEERAEEQYSRLCYTLNLIIEEENALRLFIEEVLSLQNKTYSKSDLDELKRDRSRLIEIESTVRTLSINLYSENGSKSILARDLPLYDELNKEIKNALIKIETADDVLIKGKDFREELREEFSSREIQAWNDERLKLYKDKIEGAPFESSMKASLLNRINELEKTKRDYTNAKRTLREHIMRLRDKRDPSFRRTRDVKMGMKDAKEISKRYKSDISTEIVDLLNTESAIKSNTKLERNNLMQAISYKMRPIKSTMILYSLFFLSYLYFFSIAYSTARFAHNAMMALDVFSMVLILVSSFVRPRMNKTVKIALLFTSSMSSIFTFVVAGENIRVLYSMFLNWVYYPIFIVGSILILFSRLRFLDKREKHIIRMNLKTCLKYIFGIERCK